MKAALAADPVEERAPPPPPAPAPAPELSLESVIDWEPEVLPEPEPAPAMAPVPAPAPAPVMSFSADEMSLVEVDFSDAQSGTGDGPVAGVEVAGVKPDPRGAVLVLAGIGGTDRVAHYAGSRMGREKGGK